LKTILIAAFDNAGNEPEALRQALEAFGYFVVTTYIGRPSDLMDALSGRLPLDPDALVLSCHGQRGTILMPVLGESVYREDEPRGPFSAREIASCLRLSHKIILNLGCSTGCDSLSEVFRQDNTYIAPADDVAGNSALMFAIRFFYELAQNGRSVSQACEQARAMDDETSLFRLR